MSKVYSFVTERILNQLKEGVVPWEAYAHPNNKVCNHFTGREYNGINRLLLPPGEYLTFNQIRKLSKEDKSVKLKKGSKSDMVVAWIPLDKDRDKKGERLDIKSRTKSDKDKSDEDEYEDFHFSFRYFNVFNIEKVEGVEAKYSIDKDFVPEDDVPEVIENLIEQYSKAEGCEVIFKPDISEGYYDYDNDKVICKALMSYDNYYDFAHGTLHDIIHSTCRESRQGRGRVVGSSMLKEAKEELTCEIGASFLLAELGIQNKNTEEKSVEYLDYWIKTLSQDDKLITGAAQQAEKVCNYILQKLELKKVA